MICYVLFVFSILISGGGGQSETPAYKPTDVFLINSGATSNTNDTNGRTWTPEQMNVFASNLLNGSFTSTTTEVEQSVPLVPYITARISQSKFTYSCTVLPGWKFLRLHFYPTSDLNTIKSIFSVTLNGITLLRNFKPALTASSSGFIIKEFTVPVLSGHKTLNLTFTPSRHSSAFINGVEIISMPDRLYTKGGFDGYIRNVGSNSDFKIDDKTVLETVYRLNIAGNPVDVVNDTGMFRRWFPDDDFILKKDFVGSGTIRGSEIKINYTEKTPAYVAPEDVYSTYRTMSNNKYPKQNPEFSMTWVFPVDAGFNYLVRLHFCETMTTGVIDPGKRLFSISIGNKVVKDKTDVLNLSGGPLIPIYLDFHTFLASNASKSGKSPLRLDLHPYKNSSQFYSFNLDGIEILKLNDTKGNLAGSNQNPIKLHVLVIILIAVGSAIGLVSFIAVLILSMRQMKRKENSVVVFKVPLKQYTYKELKKITNSFSHMVGKGGFGIVYGGSLSNGVKVAVKVLKDLKGNGEDFLNEVAGISQTSHVNIVCLLGFCYEGSKRAIVYEFLENGSLDQFISRENSSTLDVTTLYGIALGTARGLEYLHYGCKTRIVHFDIKPQNILLDDNLCPKVADFGLAKLCEKRESIVSLIEARGTIGYIAPEVFSRTYGGVSYKSDVYSYGMLVLEMMGARDKETTASNASTAYFPDWIYKDLENGEQTWRFGDEITGEEKEIAKKMILVALWCIQPCPSDRPPINRVVEMMEGSLDALEVPPKPSMHIVTEHIAEPSSLSNGGETCKSW